MIFNVTGQPGKVLPVRRIENSKKKKNQTNHQISLTPESYRQVKYNKTKKLLKCEKLFLII